MAEWYLICYTLHYNQQRYYNTISSSIIVDLRIPRSVSLTRMLDISAYKTVPVSHIVSILIVMKYKQVIYYPNITT